MRRIHTLAGLFIAPLILVAAFSGFFYALAPTIETWVYDAQLTATSSSPAQPVTKQISAAKRIHPDLDVAKVQVPDERWPSLAWLCGGTCESKKASASPRRSLAGRPCGGKNGGARVDLSTLTWKHWLALAVVPDFRKGTKPATPIDEKDDRKNKKEELVALESH